MSIDGDDGMMVVVVGGSGGSGGGCLRRRKATGGKQSAVLWLAGPKHSRTKVKVKGEKSTESSTRK